MSGVQIERSSIIYVSDDETSSLTVFTLVISSIGIALCGIALILLFLTAILFAEWRQSYKNQLLIQLMLARFIYTFVRFIYDVRYYLKIYDNSGYLIYLDHAIMVYTELALISWMFVFSRQMYQNLVKVFYTRSSIWKVVLYTWLVPGVVSLFINLIFFVQKNNDFTVFFLYFIITKWPVLVANAILLIRILKSLLTTNSTANNLKTITMMIVLIFVFCFQQLLIDICKVLYILVFDQIITEMSYLLIFSNIYLLFHCTGSIVFWIFGNANTRKLWKSVILCKTVASKTQLGVRVSW